MWRPAAAVMVDDLYVAEVLVSSQDATQLKRGARAGLLQVLVRVSGSRDVEQSSLILNALRNPEAYYYQYSYESTDRQFQIGDELVPARILRLHFEPSAIARLLREAALPVWGSNRPAILSWIAIDDGTGRKVLSEQDTSPLITALNSQANLRGLPVMYPLMDLEDAALVSAAEIWGMFLSRVDEASLRYNPDCVLMGRLQKDGSGQWAGYWAYRIDERWKEISNVGYSREDVINDVVDILADELAQRFALDSSRGSVELVIEDVDTLEDYAAVSQYLARLTPVLDAQVKAVNGHELHFSLRTEGQARQLIEIIELDERMVLLNDGSGTGVLHYRWLR